MSITFFENTKTLMPDFTITIIFQMKQHFLIMVKLANNMHYYVL